MSTDFVILVVDDNEGSRYAKCRTLSHAGFHVVEAATGQEALQAVREHSPAVTLLDIKLPDISGIEISRIIKRDFPGVMIAHISASFVSADDRVKGLNSGGDAYLVQPIEPTELIAVVNALIRLHKAELGVRELNDRLEATVAERTKERDRIWQLSRDLLAVTDLDGNFRACNPAWHSVLGWSQNALESVSYQSLIHPEEFAETQSALNLLQSGVTSRSFENRIQGLDGKFLWFSWTAFRDNGSIYLDGRDITAAKAAAHSLALAEEKLRQAQKMEALGQLTGGVAHDFNNLLTVVIGNIETLLRRIHTPTDGDKLKRSAENAMKGAQRAATLTRSLLAFSRRQSLSNQVLDPNKVILNISGMLRRTLGEHVEWIADLQDDIWPIYTDQNQLENAILNLTLNSRDAMPDGGKLTIKTRNIPGSGAESPDSVRLSVSDTGIGMSDEVRRQAMEPFFTTKEIGTGSGLGLSQVYGYVSQTGGEVEIESALGQGTTVTLIFPRTSHVMQSNSDRPDSLEPPRANPGELVLIVEDDEDVRAHSRDMLEELGYATMSCTTAREALHLLKENRDIALLFTDIGLPGGVNGVQLAKLVGEFRPDLPILFTTAYARDAFQDYPDGLRAPTIITKPFSFHELAESVREALDARVATAD